MKYTKKVVLVVILTVLMFMSTNAICTADTLVSKGGEQKLVNLVYETLNERPMEFEGIMLQSLTDMFKSGRTGQVVTGVGLLTILESYYDDKRSCARTVEEIESIEKMKTALRMGTGGQYAIEFLKTLNPGNSGMSQKEVTQMQNDYFNRSLPLMKKLYSNNPSRKYCKH